MNFNNVLKSKYLYYAAVALMVINVLGYVSLGSIECVMVLGGAAYLANQFTKNRTVDIFIGLFVSNILFGCGRLKEGFVEGNKTAGEKAHEAACKASMEAEECKKNGGTRSDGSCKCPVTNSVAKGKNAASNTLTATAISLKKGDETKKAADKSNGSESFFG
jgi:hypothetical protein